MNFKWILLLVLAFTSVSLQAQIESDVSYGATDSKPKDLFKTVAPQRGIYTNFTELKSNTPGGLSEFTSRSLSGPIPTYEIRGGKKNKRIRNAYGFSDGQSVFINANNYGRGNYYVKVELIGPYLFFRDAGGGGIGLGGAIGIGPVAIGTGSGNRIRGYILNMDNGVISTLNAKTMRAILAKDRELLKAYENEKQRNNVGVLYEYVRLYNDKYGY